MPCSVVSDQDLHCLLCSKKVMVGTYGLNRVSENRGIAEVKQGTSAETYPC